MSPVLCFPLADAAFQRASGQCGKQILRSSIPPEPETRNGLSLARNDAFAAITRSTLPTCAFASAPKFLRKPVRLTAPSLGPVSKPVPGEFIAANPLPAPNLRRSRAVFRSPLPFRSFLEPSGSKRSTGFNLRSSPGLTPVGLSLPAALSFDFAADQRSKPRSRPAWLSSRKPWN
jgi:hypothetical protein